jgi:diadenosine tetraphosphate (Ap4A) HIT family hydrolase
VSETCPLCAGLGEDVIWHNDFCRVVWVGDAEYPAYCRVILNAHVREMTDLPPHERARLMEVVFAVEATLREVVQPDKINLASLGNVVPHVHWHVIPRRTDDVNFPDAIWAPPRRQASPLTELAAEKIQAQLREKLAAALG